MNQYLFIKFINFDINAPQHPDISISIINTKQFKIAHKQRQINQPQ